MREIPYEELEHTADWALKVRGRDMADLLENAAIGMMELAGVETLNSGGRQRRVEIRAQDRESMLVDWLHELLVALELKSMAFRDIKLNVGEDGTLSGTVQEVPLAAMAKQVKAVTYHELKVEDGPHGLEATVVFDV